MDNFRDSYFPVTWDLTKKRIECAVWGKQFDTGRGLSITLKINGVAVTPSNEIIRLKWEKPDKTTGYVGSVIVGDKFIIENIDQMFTVHGAVRADLELQVADEFVASITFYASVEKAVAVDAVESSSEFTALQSALLDVGTVLDSLDGYVDAESVRVANESGRVTAEGLRANAETGRANAEIIRQTGYATMDEAIALKADLSEIEAARGTETTLGARLDSTDANLAEKVQAGNSLVLGNEEFELVKILEHQSDCSHTLDVGDGFILGGTLAQGYSKYDYDLNRIWRYFPSTNGLGFAFEFDANGNIYVPTIAGIEVINSLGIYQKTLNAGLPCRVVVVDRANSFLYFDYNGSFRKTDLDGNLIWEDATRDAYPRAIHILPSGRIAVGRYSTTAALICYNSDGTVYWTVNNPYRVTAIESDEQSNLYVQGNAVAVHKLKSNNGEIVWQNNSLLGYHERHQISKDGAGNLYVSNFTTGANSFFAKISMSSGNIIAKNSYGARHNMIKFIGRNLIVVNRAVASGGDYMTAVYRLKNPVLEVL